MIPAQVNEIPAHFIHEIKTKGYDVIGVNLFLPKLMKFLPKKEVNSVRAILLALSDIQKTAAGETRVGWVHREMV